jgi:hypothetical protein
MARPTPRRGARPAPSARPSAAEARHSAARDPLAPSESWWSRLSGRTQHLVCLAFLLVVGAAFYAPAVFSGKGVVGYDVVQWRAMASSMYEFHEATGDEPLWAVNPFGGMPGIMVAYFATAPGLDTLVNAVRTVNGPLAAFLVLACGVYGLVWFVTREKLAAVLAAVGFALTTYLPIILMAGHTGKFMALSYAPWLLWAFAYALRRPGLLAALLFAVALGVNLRAGHPQITYYAAFAIGLWWLVEGISALRAREAARFGKATGLLALGTVLAIALVAHPYLLQLEYKDYTARGAASAAPGAEDAAWNYAMAWSQGGPELLTLLVSGAYGGPSPTYFGPKTLGTAGPHYVGPVVLLLAVVALVASPRRRVAVGLGVAALVMTLFSLGEHFATFNRIAFDLIPYFDTFRVPETWLSMVALTLAVLAGLGAAALGRERSEGRGEKGAGNDSTDHGQLTADRRAARIAWFASLVLLFFTIVLFGSKGNRAYTGPGEADRIREAVAQQNNVPPSDPRVQGAVDGYLAEQRALRADLYTDALLRTLVFLALAAGLLWLYRRERLPAWALQAGLALLVTVDLFGVGRRYFDGERLVENPDPKDRIERYAYDAFIEERVQAAGGAGHFRAFSLEGDPGTTARPAAHYETLGGYHGAKLRVYQDFLEHILRTPQGGLNPNALKLMGVRYVVAPQPVAPGQREVFSDAQTGMKVYEDTTARRAWLASEVRPVNTPAEAWAAMQAPDFDVHRTALVLPGTAATTTPLAPDSARTDSANVVRLAEYGPREIRYRVQTDAPRLLVLSEIYYPAGWTATVDDQSAPIHQVNYLLRGVQVPAGAHTVTMRFDPPRYRLGQTISWAASVVVYGGIVLLVAIPFVRRRRRDEPEDPSGNAPDEASA